MTPSIVLAFSNNRVSDQKYLRDLPTERRRLMAALKPIELQKGCRRHWVADATQEDLWDVFLQNRDSLAIFHFAGHASQDYLVFETQTGDASRAFPGGLARFLGRLDSLRLVFLNACVTFDQAEKLIQAGVPAVIATADNIMDRIATDFSDRFYRGLAAGLSIEESFDVASDAIQTAKGRPRACYRNPSSNQATAGNWPWRLLTGSDQAAQWRLWHLPEPNGTLPLAELDETELILIARWLSTDAARILSGEEDLPKRFSLGARGGALIEVNTAPLKNRDLLRTLDLISETIGRLKQDIQFYEKKTLDPKFVLNFQGVTDELEEKLNQSTQRLVQQLGPFVESIQPTTVHGDHP